MELSFKHCSTTSCLCDTLMPPQNNCFCLTLSNLKEFADDNFKFGENVEKFSEMVDNTVARYEQFLLLPQCFQKTFTADT